MSCCQEHAHTAVTTAPVKSAQSKSIAKTGCQCEGCRTGDTCCELLCFERPNYFCGHLLTDADLLREQNYFREKNKLYHRTLHGHGIVCGLRILCDGECEGHVRIEEGYAIDDCGNDLVVCNPLRYNVLKALRDKGWLVDAPKPDPCKPEQKDEDCHTRQCFYIAACYHEEPGDFTAPFVPGCKPKLTDCEPTRIREMVTFEVLNELPPKAGPFDELRKRIEPCFDLFSKGPFAQYLHDNADAIEEILTGSDNAAQRDCKKLFCDLRGFLLLYLKKHPDRYNCRLEADVRAIPLPMHDNERRDDCRGALCALIKLAVSHAFSCAINEFMPHCAEPSKASCVVLGTVEVESGEIVHVCNCPREYVWSFANFFEVLQATLISDNLCEDKSERKSIAGLRGEIEHEDPCKPHGRHVCCTELDISCEEIVQLLSINPKALHYQGMVGLDAVASMREAFAGAFDFTRKGVYSPQMFSSLTPEQATAGARKLHIRQPQFEKAALQPQPVAPFEMLRRVGLATGKEELVLSKSGKQITSGHMEVPVVEFQAMQKRIAALEARFVESPGKPGNPNTPRTAPIATSKKRNPK